MEKNLSRKGKPEMKTRIDEDEWYPVWNIDLPEGRGDKIDVPSNQLARWRRIFCNFGEIQQEITDIWRKTCPGKENRK